MIEAYTYKLINAVLAEELPELKFIDLYRNQYNRLNESTRPFNQESLFIEFVPRTDITTRNKTCNEGELNIRLHVLAPRPDNVSARKKNINDGFKAFELADSIKRIMNSMDTSKYESGTTVHNLELTEGKYYQLESGHLTSTNIINTNEFDVIQLLFTHSYQDDSMASQLTYATGWTYTISPTVHTTASSIEDADFNSDFDADFDIDSNTSPIYFSAIYTSGDTMTISGYSYNEYGIPLPLQYCVDTINWYDNNVFTSLSGGTYLVAIRNSRGDSLTFDHEITI